MKKLWQSCLHSQETKASFFQKREDLYTLDALFVCYLILSCLFIVNQIVSYFTTSELSGEYMILFIPIGLLLIFISVTYALKVKVFKLSFDKEKYPRYILRFDLLKAGAYIIFSLIIIESRLLQISLKSDSTFDYGRWLVFELELITLPALMSMQTPAIRISLIVLQFLYCYLRMESWSNDVANAAFFFAKIFPVVFCLYKFCIFEEILRKDKGKQAEDRKFASKILDLLPEGVAIIDENGLKYNNNSLRSILRVKDNGCLEALFKLENKEYVEISSENGVKRGQSYTPSTQFDMGKHDALDAKNSFLKNGITGLSTNRESNPRSPPENLRKLKKNEPSKLYKVIVDDQKSGKRKASHDVKPQLENGSRDLEANHAIYEPLPLNSPGSINQQNDSIGTIGDNSHLLAPWKGNTKQIEKPPSPSRWKKLDSYNFNQPNKEEKQETAQSLVKDAKSIKKSSMASLAEIGIVRLRIKQIIDRIYQPYKRSQHRNVGEATKELLSKLKDKFSQTEDMQYSKFVKQQQASGSDSSHQKYVSRSATFDNGKPKHQKQNSFYTMKQWAMVMNSERESLSGSLQRLEIKFTPIVADEKPSIIILVRDVTEKEIIRQMEEKERNQSQALAAVSHEFRTPLNGILGMLDTLKEHIENTVCQNFLMPAYNSAKLLLTLVNDILDFHQMKEQKLTLVPVEFNLKSKLEDCLSLISIQAKRRGVEAKVMMDEDVPIMVNNDPNRMQQVVNNLLGNAIKFTLHGSIIIKVENCEGNRITIKVIDTGLGIEAKNIEKLFKTFGKIDSQKNRELNPQGVGLGLTISNSLAELLCSDKKVGGLNVVSEYQKGSCFWFVIDDLRRHAESCEINDDDEKPLFDNMEELNSRYPFSKREVQPDTQEGVMLSSVREILTDSKIPKLRSALLLKLQEKSDPDPLHKRVINTEPFLLNDQEATLKDLLQIFKAQRNISASILVADDNDINQLVFQSFLKSFDVTVDSVYNGKQAIDKVLQKNMEQKSQPYQIVFLDVEMPTMGGLECAAELVKLIKSGVVLKFPIIGQSGHDDEEEIGKCMQVGMSGYLRKPITRPQLIDTLIKWIKKEIETSSK